MEQDLDPAPTALLMARNEPTHRPRTPRPKQSLLGVEPTANKRPEPVNVLTVVVLPRCLSDVEGGKELLVVVVGAVPSPFQERPEALDSVGVTPCEVGEPLAVVDGQVRYEGLYGFVGFVLIGNQYAALGVY